MNKSLVTAIVVAVIALGIIVVVAYSQLPKGATILSNNAPVNIAQNNNQGGIAKIDIGKGAAVQISELVRTWAKNNNGSYAGFLANENNIKKMRRVRV